MYSFNARRNEASPNRMSLDRHPRRTEHTQRSAKAFRFGLLGGRANGRIPLDRRTSRILVQNFGSVASSEVQTYDVTLQAGTPYRQLVLRDDRPLLATEETKERENLAKSIAGRRQETAAERATRLTVYEKRPDWRRAVWHELPDAFDFRAVGEKTLDGRSLLVIEGVAQPGYKSRSSTAKIFRSLKLTFWVDQQEFQIVRVEAEVIDAISVGLFLVRVAKGSRATLELKCVDDGVWLPDRLQILSRLC